MCGLLAGSGKLNAGIITALGCQNEKRGDDSSGIGWVEGKKAYVDKIALHPLVAFPKFLYNSIQRASKSSAMIGHTRMATTGDVNSKNAHPFLDKDIVFAHNGIIVNHEKFGKYEVDSQSLIHGIKKRDFSEYEGPIALVWLEKGKLHAFRKGNPLFRGLLKGAIYLASERTFLGRLGCTRIKEMAEGRIYTFNGSQVVNTQSVPTNSVVYWKTDYGHEYDYNDKKFWEECDDTPTDITKLDKAFEEKLLEENDKDKPPNELVIVSEGDVELDPDEELAKEIGLGYYQKAGRKHYGLVPQNTKDGKLRVGF